MALAFVPGTHYLVRAFLPSLGAASPHPMPSFDRLVRWGMQFSGSKDRVIKYWDCDKFEQIVAMERHRGEVMTAARVLPSSISPLCCSQLPKDIGALEQPSCIVPRTIPSLPLPDQS